MDTNGLFTNGVTFNYNQFLLSHPLERKDGKPDLLYALAMIIREEFNKEMEWLPKKVRFSFEKLFKEESKNILATLRKYEEKAERINNFEEYVFSIPQKMNDLKEMLLEIEQYPLKTITKKIKKRCTEAKIDHHLVVNFIKNIKTAVINTVIKHAIAYETKKFQPFYEAEVKRININYYVQNPAVKILTPNHYQKHVGLISNTVKAYGSDLQAFLVRSKYDYNTVWNFFDYLQQHIKSLHEYHQTQQIIDDMTSTNLAS
uniref:hypothetical protein n=1 Tax=Flavobacterium sp. TaxID=239 RepID=UPI00404947A8